MVAKTILGWQNNFGAGWQKKNWGIRVVNFFEVGTIFLEHGVTKLSGGAAAKINCG